MSSKALAVTNQLWAMANKLRGKMEAPQYRDYILGFMFYRFLSEHQEAYLVNNDLIDVAAEQTANEAYCQQAVGDDLADYLADIAASLGYAIAPDNTWATLMTKIEQHKLIPEDFAQMFEAFEQNAEINPNAAADFRGVFSDINLSDSRLGDQLNSRTQSLADVALLVNQFEYKDDDGHDILGDVYEYLISQFASASVKKAGEFYTPHEVSKLMAKIVATNVTVPQTDFSVYDFACGSGSLLLTLGAEIPMKDQTSAIEYYGQELSTTTYNLARMNLMMHGVRYDHMELRNADTLERDWPMKAKSDPASVAAPEVFDAVVANPPYSAEWDNADGKLKDPRFKDYGGLAPKKKADYAFLLHGLYHLNNEGTMAIVLPHGVLFRGAKEAKIRQALLEKGQIEAIIGLPEKLFYSTGIPTIVMVLKKHRANKDVLFIDASREFEKGKNKNILRAADIEKIVTTYQQRADVAKYAHVATYEEIQENDFNLNIPRYVDTFEPPKPIDVAALATDATQTSAQLHANTEALCGLLGDLTSADAAKLQQLNHMLQALKGEA